MLLFAMAALLALCGGIVAGSDGIVWSVIAGAIVLPVVGHAPPDMLLRAMGAHLLTPSQAPDVCASFLALCRDAGLSPVPRLCHIADKTPLAFSLGRGESAAVVVTDSLLVGLSERELVGILAHEIVHLRRGDIVMKQLGFVLGTLTRIMAQLGILMLFFGLLLRALSVSEVPLISLVVLVVAPFAAGLLQLAMSREREAEADLGAAELTGDPAGLAAALIKLQRWQEWRLRRLFPTARPFHLPTLLNDHPPTAERIRRLLNLAQYRGEHVGQ
ncbi:MAG: zinc metalloprotease HtpX [Thiohalocapsa sp.]